MSASARRKIVEQHQTIEQLQARVAELEAEVERKMSAGAYVLEQLAAAQAEIKRLREVLLLFKKYEDDCESASSDVDVMISYAEASNAITEALAQPSDTSALDAYVAEKVKEVEQRLDRRMADIALQAERYVSLQTTCHTLTRQRDLAVEAMREALACGEDGDWQSARRILASAIKESEVK